jgi:hypothetical protein
MDVFVIYFSKQIIHKMLSLEQGGYGKNLEVWLKTTGKYS